ncbi:MAG: DUF3995 domain-containing protein [Acidimicrobiales bacterium]
MACGFTQRTRRSRGGRSAVSSAPMTLGVVGLIAVGAGLVGLEARRLDHEHTAPSTPLGRLRRIAAIGVPAVLALRGVGGLVVSSFGLGEATEEFRHWDLRLYSPLCVVLAGLAWLAVRPADGRQLGRWCDRPPIE